LRNIKIHNFITRIYYDKKFYLILNNQELTLYQFSNNFLS